MNTLFQSERLLFREFAPDDAELIYELNKDPDVTKYVHEPPTTPEMAVEVLNNIIIPQYKANNYGRWAVHLKDNKEFIGWGGLKKTPSHEFPDLGYRFFKHLWGYGYATEAAMRTIEYGFETLHLEGVFAAAHVDNIGSIKVLEKCGMVFNGLETIDGAPTRTYVLRSPETN